MSPLRPLPSPWVLALFAAALAGSGCKRRSTLPPATDYAQPLRIDFRPPVDRALTETVTVSLHRGLGEAPAAAPTEPPSDGVTLTTVSRFSREGQAWVLEQRTPQLQVRQGGATVDSPLAGLLQRIPLRVQLAGDGAFVRVLDAERGEAELAKSGLDEATQESLRDVVGADALQERARREWTAKYGGVFGRNLQLGQKLYALDVLPAGVPAGSGERGYVLERTLSGTLLTDYGEALVFTLRCLGEAAPDAPAELRALVETSGSLPLEPSVSCDGEQVVARGTFVPVRSHLSVRVGAGGSAAEVWTWSRRTAAQELED